MNVPADGAIVLIGGDSTECFLVERKLKNLGLITVKRYDRAGPVLTLLEARELDLIYLVGSPVDMDALTFIRAARSGKIPAGIPIFLVVRPNARLPGSEKEFLKAYGVTTIKMGMDDEKAFRASIRPAFQDSLNKASVVARLEAAKRLLRDGLTSWAAKAYEEILAEEAINVTARVGLMRASAANPGVYWTQLQKLLEQDPKNYYFKFEQIDRLVQERRAEEAQGQLEGVMEQLKQDGELFWLVELGVLCVAEKIFPFCFKLVEMIRRKARKEQLWQGDLLESRTHLAAGSVDEATRFLAAAIRHAPGPRAEIENLRAILARKRGGFQEAAGYYQEALRLAPEDHRVAFNIGLCHEHAGDAMQALGSYKKALALSPSYVRAQTKIDELERRLTDGAVPVG